MRFFASACVMAMLLQLLTMPFSFAVDHDVFARPATLWQVSLENQRREPTVAQLPKVQCVIYSDSPRCAPCRALCQRLKQRLVEEVQQRGERPWRVGSRRDSHFRVVEFTESPDEFAARGVDRFPTVVFVVDGDEIPTGERDPAKLAQMFLDYLNSVQAK